MDRSRWLPWLGFAASLIAVLYFALRDSLAGARASFPFLAGGLSAVLLVIIGVELAATSRMPRWTASGWRRATMAISIGVPLVDVGLRAGGDLAEGAPSTFAYLFVIALVAAVASEVAIPRVEALAEDRDLWRSCFVASCVLAVLFLHLHLGEGTFVAMKEGRESLHQSLYVATWLAWLGLLLPWGYRVRVRRLSPESRRLALALGSVSVLAGLLGFEADRRVLVGLHPELHQWIEVVSLLNLEGGLLLFVVGASPSAPGRSWAKRSGLASLCVLVLAAVSFVVIPPSRRDSSTLAAISTTALGPGLTHLRTRGRGVSFDGYDGDLHPLLDYEKFHDEVTVDPKYNVMLVTIDTIRADSLASQDGPAPGLAKLGERCVVFERGYAPGPRTAIGLGSLMNGRYSAHLEWDLWRNHRGRTINPRTATPEELEKFGPKYRHRALPREPKDGGVARRVERTGMHTMAVTFAGKNPILQKGIAFDGGFIDFHGATHEEVETPSSEALVDIALGQIREANAVERRWFHWLHLFDPHESGGKRKKYERRVRGTDRALSRMFDELEADGILATTVIMIAGDHGEGLGDHRFPKHGTALYDEQTRVPMIVCHPTAEPRRVAEPASTLDLAATIVAVAGGPLDGFDGVNLLPFLEQGRDLPRRPVFLELHRYRGHSTKIGRDKRGVVLDEWKYIHDRLEGGRELYDLGRDPRELDNVLAEHPEVGEELDWLLGSFMADGERRYPPPG